MATKDHKNISFEEKVFKISLILSFDQIVFVIPHFSDLHKHEIKILSYSFESSYRYLRLIPHSLEFDPTPIFLHYPLNLYKIQLAQF